MLIIRPHKQTKRRLAAFGAFWALCFAFALLLHWPSHDAGHGLSLAHESASCIACQVSSHGLTVLDDAPASVPIPDSVFGLIAAPPAPLRAPVALPATDSPACLRGPPASAS